MSESVNEDDIQDQPSPTGDPTGQVGDKRDAQPVGYMRELVTDIARALVDEPEAVRVDVQKQPEGTVLRLRVARVDVGKVIGKQGRTARSLRTILSAASMKLHHRYSLDILEVDDLEEAEVGNAKS